jgi:hypothetical protein
MTLTGHWHRIDKRTSELWARTELEPEKQKWLDRWKLYCRMVDACIMEGRSINRSRVFAFRFIVRQSLLSIQETLDIKDILERETPKSTSAV